MAKILLFLSLLIIICSNQPAFAVSDPRSNPNNKVGINILSPEAEIKEAAQLVNNNNGQWGWIVVVVKKTERNLDRWQSLLNLAAKHKLIPIIRLATEFDSNGYWQKPTDEDAAAWADFLSKLYWPTKNRYVQVYNEVNRSAEWGGYVDAADYAKELNKTISALKAKNSDFFVLNAPLDLALNNSPTSIDPALFFQTMESTVAGIFHKLDGWASHSYPNPDFSASPYKSGRTAINGYKWELSQISPYLKGKELPVFITETGWRRGDSQVGGLTEKEIADFYKIAFEKVWNDKRIVAVAPFVFDYPESLYHPFSFKKNGGSTGYYDYHQAIKEIEKVKGEPERENKAEITQSNVPQKIINNSKTKIKIKIKNMGNYIWDTQNSLSLSLNSENIELHKINWSTNEVYPGQQISADLIIKGNSQGPLPFTLIFSDNSQVLAEKEFTVESKTYFALLVDGIQAILGI